jgi:23S rRNA (adenine-N6)-dimethyltransferase
VSGRGGRSPPTRSPSEPDPRRWGWHRLSDPAAARVVAAAGILPGDLVVDVGAGEGALTRPLLDTGARVIAVELHPRRCETLRARFGGEPVTVVELDAGRFRWPAKPFRVVANPPYAVWAALLRALLAPGSRLVSADIVLQRRVVRRIVDDAAAPSRARARSRNYIFERGLAVPRTSFLPPPRVDSAVLRIRRRV